MKIHKSISIQDVTAAVNDYHTTTENPGFCIACGERHEGCEPDARGYRCENCNKLTVYGAEEVLLMMA